MRTLSASWIALLLVIPAYGWLTWIAVRLPLEGEDAPPGSPWPKPQNWTSSNELKTLDPDHFHFQSDVSGCDVIDQAVERYSQLIHLHKNAGPKARSAKLENLKIDVKDSGCEKEKYPSFNDSEGYSLEIGIGVTATLTADTIWGVVRGLETFSQLIYLNEDNEYLINQTAITDSPRFRFRGLMIDTARHFLPIRVIHQILDAMSWDKYNVLHWHVVDDQSFPYPSRTFPNLTEYGAYTPHHTYSREDVDSILGEARLRGIHVIPEFDTPGHTWSWGRAFPDLLTPCWGNGTEGGPDVPNYNNHGVREILNPMQEYTYSFLEEIYKEITTDFPDEYVHLGMDEVYYACWQSNPNISAWMETRGFTEYNQVEQYYAERLINITENLGSKYIIWQDPADKNVTVAQDTIVTVWKDTENGLPGQFEDWEVYMNRIAPRGYRMLLSAPWYMNMITYGQDFKKYYEVEPTRFTENVTLQNNLWGGEACVWAEYIDSTNFHSIVWPRASAVAERLWSSKETNDVEEAKYRLDQQRCRMVRRGIPAKPLMNGHCGDYEWGMEDPDDDNKPVTEQPGTDEAYIEHASISLITLVVLLAAIMNFN